MTYAVGIDLGGTKTDILVRRGTVTRALNAEGGNLRLDDAAATARRLASAIGEVTTQNKPVRVCMGAAGGDDAAARNALRTELFNHLPGLEHATILSDQRIAWEAAFGGAAGVLVIVGTGSGCFTVDASGCEHRTGGWGPRVGDPGSGRSLGAAALRVALAAAESGAYSALAEHVARHLAGRATLFGPDRMAPHDLLRFVYARDFDVSTLAPVVLSLADQHGSDALDLAMDEATALAAQCRRLVATAPPSQQRIALMGGLTRSAAYVRVLEAALDRVLPNYDVAVPDVKPVMGALRLALEG